MPKVPVVMEMLKLPEAGLSMVTKTVSFEVSTENSWGSTWS